MQVLAPHISCICNPNELAEVIAQGYKEIYIVTIKGTFKHHILRGADRYVRTKVDSIPGYTEPTIQEGMNFLPAGKISYSIYEQVLAFFRKVMEVKVAEVEAMIHVLYNKELGYHLGVPPQRISKASVAYDWSYIPEGTSIIVDIHSHNTMGAFFSGTDDRDDRGNISFSGVFGKLKDKEPMTIWRFNYYEKKYAASVEDLFETPVFPNIEIPAEWLDNVNVTIPTYTVGGRSNQGNVLRVPNPNPVTSGATHEQIGRWRYQPENQPVKPNPNPATVRVASDFGVFEDDNEDLLHFFGGDLPANPLGQFGLRGRSIPTTSVDETEGMEFNPKSGLWEPVDPEGPDFGVNSTREDPDEEVDPVGKSSGELALLDEANDSPDGITDPEFEAIYAIHGAEVAEAWWSISTEMSTLDGKDELNQELICDMAGLSSEEGQLKIISALFDNLSPKNKAKIETFGFV